MTPLKTAAAARQKSSAANQSLFAAANLVSAVGALTAIILLANIHTAAAQSTICYHPNPDFDVQFNYSCPADTTCVVDTRYDPPQEYVAAQPVGCCPDNLPVPCFDRNSYNGLDGCCPEDASVCCYTSGTSLAKWMGCAADATQCCYDSICPPDYRCCVTTSGHGCCPIGTFCYDRPYEVTTPNGTVIDLEAIYGKLQGTDLCLPINTSTIFLDFEIALDYQNTSIADSCGVPADEILSYTLYPDSEGVYDCGFQMCFDDDECMTRYANYTTDGNYRLNLTDPDCVQYENADQSLWPPECTLYDTTFREQNFTHGCCPTDYTPCGNAPYSFDPDIGYNSSIPPTYSVYDKMFGCAAPGETCCGQTICPVGMKCCSLLLSVAGELVQMPPYPGNPDPYENIPNITLNWPITNPDMLGIIREFVAANSFCCPETATCCQTDYMFSNSRWPMFAENNGFCGLDADCTTNIFQVKNKNGPLFEGYEGIPVPYSSALDVALLAYYGDVEYGTKTESSDGTCHVKVNGNKPYACGQLGGEFTLPTGNNEAPAITGLFRYNTDPTRQILAENYYNVSGNPVSYQPRPGN